MGKNTSQKHAFIILIPLNPTFIQFKGVYIIFLISAQNIDCGYSLETPRRGGSNEYHNICLEQKYEKYQGFYLNLFQFLVVKFSIYLNRRVFVMAYFRNLREDNSSEISGQWICQSRNVTFKMLSTNQIALIKC